MLARFDRNDVAVVAHYLGTLIMLFGLIMAAPLVVSLVFAEWDISCHYVLGIGISLLVGALLRLARIEPQRMRRKHALAITGMIWVLGAVLAAIPLYLSGHYANFLDAVFEGVSGLTATGLTLVQDIEHLSMADNMWRFTMQFVGGQGVVVVALSLGLFSKSGSTLYNSEGRDEGVVPNIRNTAQFIWKFAIAAVAIGTVAIGVILLVMGMEPGRGILHALWITIGAYDTGGFSPGSLSLIAYHSWFLEILAMLLMMFGALNFALVAQVQKGNWREFIRDIEVRTLALWTTLMVVIFIAALASSNFVADYSALMRRGVFTIVSATTNTGFQVFTTSQITTLLSSGAFFLVAIAMAIGGSSASTAGGIKALRVGLIFKGIGLSIRKILQPRSAQVSASYNHIGKHQVTSELLSSAMIIAALYTLSYIIGALVGIAYGYEAIHAMFESISAASNAGLSSGIVTPGMPIGLELLYILQMWLGRLEFITLLALIASFIASVLPRRKPKKEKPVRRRLRGLKGFKDNDGYTRPAALILLALMMAAVLTLAPLTSAQRACAHPAPAYAQTTTEATAPNSTEANNAASDGVRFASNQTPAQSTTDTSQLPAEETTLQALNTMPEYADYTFVSVKGEAVGDYINADAGHVWITLVDGEDAVSVYLPHELQDKIAYRGSYAYEGTQLELVGEFHSVCDQHDGTSDIHASAITQVYSEGGPTEHTVDYLPLVIGIIAIALSVILVMIYSYISKRRL